jgi:hexosaminidase
VIVPAPAKLAPGEPLGEEGYRLTVRGGEATIEAETDAGRFYAQRTLERLPEGRDVEIADRPRFAWRGFMLDVSRHFFGPDAVRRVIDHLAAYKLNRLHLHLSDDQGWRLAIERWPKLTQVGGSSEVGGGEGGFFTQNEYRELVAYASERHVIVVPEFDMPGHVQAAIASYPELGQVGSKEGLQTEYGGGFASSLDAHSEATYRFAEDVLTQIAALTPGPYLHVGGDEAWVTDHEDYLAFMERLQPIVAATGKQLVGWEEIATTPLADGTIVQFWNTGGGHQHDGTTAVRQAVEKGARLLLSPARHVYLDMKYHDDFPLGLEWAGHVDLRDSYEWEPTEVLEGAGDAIVGIEAALWTETVTSLEELETMLLPRLAAVAEVAWSPPEARDWEDFRARIAAEGRRWDAAGVSYHRSRQVDW